MRAAALPSFPLYLVSCVLCLATACKRAPVPDPSPDAAAKAPEQASPEMARRQRLEWNLKTLTGAYEQVGKTNAAWDTFAKNALNEFARARAGIRDRNEIWEYVMATNCSAAASAGCDDPMIRYLLARFPPGPTNPEPNAEVGALLTAATDLEQSGYPPLRKFYASFRTVTRIREVYGTNVPAHLQAFLSGNRAGADLAAAMGDKTMPASEAYEACNQMLDTQKGDKRMYAAWYEPAEKFLFASWPQAATTWLSKGQGYIEMAWHARGGGYADSVSPEGWKLFQERLSVARESLEKAWELDPHDERIPTQMIRVAEGQEAPRKEMELWFNRAMALNPSNEQACRYKLHYLYPQWYGSREAMIAFGRECAASTNWNGSVPLILCEAHWDSAALLKNDAAREAYWKRPDVWPDIRTAFERYFQLNPASTPWRHQYAWYARRCEQWGELNRQLKLLAYTNYDYFGGKAEFGKMARKAGEVAVAEAAK